MVTGERRQNKNCEHYEIHIFQKIFFSSPMINRHKLLYKKKENKIVYERVKRDSYPFSKKAVSLKLYKMIKISNKRI